MSHRLPAALALHDEQTCKSCNTDTHVSFLPHRGFSIYPIQISMYIVDLRAYEQRAFC